MQTRYRSMREKTEPDGHETLVQESGRAFSRRRLIGFEERTFDSTGTGSIGPLALSIAMLSGTVLFFWMGWFENGVRNGIMAVIFAFLSLAVFLLPSGPFSRPHFIAWRFVLGLGVIYFLTLVFLLFQNPSLILQYVHSYDPNVLGPTLPHRSYAADCRLSWETIGPQLDIFVVCHVLGWFVKALVFRDSAVCWILSVMFELVEYSFEFQLPNFAECWWDHWILDVLLCNALGIVAGMWMVDKFRLKKFRWWTAGNGFRFRNYMAIVFITAISLTTELNTFYLKHLLRIPTPHNLNLYRLLLISALASAATREFYDFLFCLKPFGSFSILTLFIIALESLLCFKLGQGQFQNSPPLLVVYSWIVGLVALTIFPLLRFHILPLSRAI